MSAQSILNSREYNPPFLSEHWCNQCDNEVVSSKRKDTGKFFVFGGHAYRKNTRNTSAHETLPGHYDGDYHLVMLAYCTNCLAA